MLGILNKIQTVLIGLVLTMMILPAFVYGEEVESIFVKTDKVSYSEDEIIIISGNVSTVIGERIVIIQIIHDGSYAHLAQLQVAQDGSFTETVLVEGELWNEYGKYIVRASYQDEIAETTFEFRGSIATPSTNNKCSPGTIFSPDSNSCVLITNTKHQDNNPINENISLQEKNTQLKLENKQLKNQINELQLEIDNLQNIIHEQINVIIKVSYDLKNQ